MEIIGIIVEMSNSTCCHRREYLSTQHTHPVRVAFVVTGQKLDNKVPCSAIQLFLFRFAATQSSKTNCRFSCWIACSERFASVIVVLSKASASWMRATIAMRGFLPSPENVVRAGASGAFEGGMVAMGSDSQG